MSEAGLVEALRGDVVESRHLVHAVVARSDGEIVRSLGDAGLVTYLRSSAKPFQAMPAVADGTVERFGLGDDQLAIACSSHAGTPLHTAAVAELLQRAGVAVGALRPRGLHDPLGADAAAALRREGRVPSPLDHNCSGNHALMLARSRRRGWALDRYLEADAPTQQEATAVVEAVFGAPLQLGRDRCGMTAYALPLERIASGFAGLATGTLPEQWREAGRRVVTAMRAAPALVSGEGRIDTQTLAIDGALAKSGARGLFCCASARTGLGGALKIADGDETACTLAAGWLVETVCGERLPERDLTLADGDGNAVGRYRLCLEER